MKTKKKSVAANRFTRGERVAVKSSRRHARKHARKVASKEEFVRELETLTPL